MIVCYFYATACSSRNSTSWKPDTVASSVCRCCSHPFRAEEVQFENALLGHALWPLHLLADVQVLVVVLCVEHALRPLVSSQAQQLHRQLREHPPSGKIQLFYERHIPSRDHNGKARSALKTLM